MQFELLRRNVSIWSTWLAAVLVLTTASAAQETSRSRIEKMSPSELKELQRKRTRFENLSDVERERLRQLHASIHDHGKAEELRTVMLRYTAWLKTLSAGQRAELLDMPKEERVARIKSIMAKQEEQRFERFAAAQLNSSDHRVILEWMRGFIEQKGDHLKATLPQDVQNRFESLSSGQRRAILYSALGRNEEAITIIRDEADIAGLAAKLSEKAQNTLRAETDQLKQAAIVRNWARAAAMSGWSGSRSMPKVSDEELTRFYKDELSDKSREYLNSLPADQMKRELTRWYVFRKQRFGGGRRGEGFRGRGPRGSHERREGERGSEAERDRNGERDGQRKPPTDADASEQPTSSRDDSK